MMPTQTAAVHTLPEYRTRVRPLPALAAGLVSGLLLLAFYYATLALLPLATSYPTTLFPVSAWAHRADLSQYLGTIADPPYPTPLTWIAGISLWLGTLTSCGLIYAVLLAWTVQYSDSAKGIGFGLILGLTFALALSIAQGNHPAVMRNALPDVGVLLLGWSAWALAQLCTAYAVFGATLGILYRRWTLPPPADTVRAELFLPKTA